MSDGLVRSRDTSRLGRLRCFLFLFNLVTQMFSRNKSSLAPQLFQECWGGCEAAEREHAPPRGSHCPSLALCVANLVGHMHRGRGDAGGPRRRL